MMETCSRMEEVVTAAHRCISARSVKSFASPVLPLRFVLLPVFRRIRGPDHLGYSVAQQRSSTALKCSKRFFSSYLSKASSSAAQSAKFGVPSSENQHPFAGSCSAPILFQRSRHPLAKFQLISVSIRRRNGSLTPGLVVALTCSCCATARRRSFFLRPGSHGHTSCHSMASACFVKCLSNVMRA